MTVGFAPVKGDRPEWAVQKLTELGVDRIVLLRGPSAGWCGGSRCPRAERQVARLKEVARQALMQSRGVWLPEVSSAWNRSPPRRGLAPVWRCRGLGSRARPVGGAGAGVGLSSPVVLVGPEGGWAPEELALDVPQVGLGPGVLRTETAAVAAGVC